MDSTAASERWPAGEGEMVERIRAFDWSRTPLGPLNGWTERTRGVVDMVLASGFPTVALLGSDLVQIYNDGYRIIMGGKHPAGLGQPTRDCWPEVWNINRPIYERVRAGETVTFEDALYPITRQGAPEDAWFTLSYSPLREANGAIGGVLVTVFETTSRVRAQNALRASEERYRAFVMASSDVIYRMSPDWSEMRELVGQSFLADTHEPSADWLERYIHPADRPAVRLAIDAAIAAKSTFELEHRVVRKDGRLGWTSSRAVPVLGERGEIREWLGTATDVTDARRAASTRTEAEAALRRSEERQALLLRLSDTLRPILEPAAIKAKAMRVLGEHLRVNRAQYHEADPSGEYLDADEGYADGVPAVAGRGWTNDFGPHVKEAFSSGETVAVGDVSRDPRIGDEELKAYDALGFRAFLGVPLVKGGRWVGAVGLHHAAARDWSDTEISLAEEVAERTWAAVERARAEKQLRTSEERQSFLLALTNRLHGLSDAQDVLAVATRTLAEHLRADRVGYAEDRDRDMVVVFDCADGVPSSVDPYRYDEFGRELLRSFREGRSVVRPDIANDPGLGAAEKAAHAALQLGATVNVPLLADGELQAVLFVHFREPHPFSERELALIQGVAEQTWAAVQRVRAEAALRASEERLRQFGEASTDVLWIRDAETLGWVYLTPAFEAIYGLSREEALAGNNFRNWLDLIVPEDRGRASAIIERVRAGESVTFEYRIRRPSDGAVRWLRNTDFPIRDAGGRITAIGGVGHDASLEKEADRIIRAGRRQLRVLVEGMAQLVWRAVDCGEWTWASPQWTAFTGQSSEASTGRGWLATLHPDDREKAMEAWRSTERTEEPLDVEYRIRQAGGENYRWFQTRALPVRDEETGAILEWLGTSTDIHDMRQLQEEQAVMVAELQHRTRNLIGVIGSIARQTMAQTGPTQAFQNAFKDRLEALSRVQSLLSRAGEAPITIREVLDLELAALGAPNEGGRVVLDGPEVRLRKSIVQTLTLAIHELATNAHKYGALADGVGRLTVRWTTHRAEGEERRLFFEWVEDGVAVRFEGAEAVVQGGGYGRQLIEKSLPYSLKARTTYELGPNGLRCTIDLPLSRKRPKGSS